MKKKTLIISAISVVAAAAIATGGTLAYFTQKTDTRITSYNVCYTKLLRILLSLFDFEGLKRLSKKAKLAS